MDAIPATHSHVSMKDLISKPFLKDLQLADPDYQPNCKLDILLGIKQCNHCSLHGISMSADKNWKAKETILRWAVGGATEVEDSCTAICLQIEAIPDDASKLMQKLWSGEERKLIIVQMSSMPYTNLNGITSGQRMGDTLFPYLEKTRCCKLGHSRELPLKRYLSNERTLKKHDRWDDFNKGVNEYLEMQHAELVPDIDLKKPSSQSYYLPMHGVVKASSSTVLFMMLLQNIPVECLSMTHSCQDLLCTHS